MEPEDIVKSFIRAGVRPQLIWAACRTGRLVTDENKGALLEEDLQEWQSALDEYTRTFPNDDWDMKNISEIIVREKF